MEFLKKIPYPSKVSSVGVELARMGRYPDFRLTSNDIDQLQDAECDAERRNDLKMFRRVRAILMVGRDEMTRDEVAMLLEIDVSSIFRWQAKFRKNGVVGLATGKARGASCRLSEPQLKLLESKIEAGPEESGFDTGVWTGPLVRELVLREFGVGYSNAQICRILAQLSFSFQLPKIRLARANPEAQREWREERYPAIAERAHHERGVVFFSTSPFSRSQDKKTEPGRGWVKASRSRANPAAAQSKLSEQSA
jgi:putative transposase